MAQCGKVCLTGVKEILSKKNHADANLSDAQLTAKLEAGLQICKAGQEKPTEAMWIDLLGRVCLEIFPRGLNMGPGEWTYTTIPFKPTPRFPTVSIEVAHLDSAIAFMVEGQSYQSPNTEVLLHFKMDTDACGWQLPVTFTLRVPGCDAVSRSVILQEYIGKPDYQYLSIGTITKQNLLGECKVTMTTMDRSNNKKTGLTVHGFLFRSGVPNN